MQFIVNLVILVCEGKLPCLIEGKRTGEIVEDIACDAYYVAVLASRNEGYTCRKAANGRLGLGDIEYRKTPTLIEALEDQHVKFIPCGSTYRAALCLHKWISGVPQSQCSSCRCVFGFPQKKHNCYDSGLVTCHSCTCRKGTNGRLLLLQIPVKLIMHVILVL